MTGSAAGKYTAPAATTVTGEITPKPLSTPTTAITREFDGTATLDSVITDNIGQLPGDTLTITRTASLQEVMAEILKIDIAIVSRYHNLLCALKLDRPTLSLGYAEKNDELMREFGRADFCRHIETFEVEEVLRQVHTMLADLAEAGRAIAGRNAAIRAELARQQDLLLSEVLIRRGGRTLPLARDALR